MTEVEPVIGDLLISKRQELEQQIRSYRFPELVGEEVTDDGETFMALRCPRCGHLVTADSLSAISPAEHWAYADDVDSDDAFDYQRITFYVGESPDLDETLYYQHNDDHAVNLPDGWKEEWK